MYISRLTPLNMASIGWIDFSPSHRNRVGSVLDLLSPEGMVDELGLGTIRDGLANQLFPGISTIQTRAKYFFIIPYILYEYQILKPHLRKGKTPAKYLEDREYEIMWQLAEQYHYAEGNGVIGISKRKPNKIVRRPSAIYWNGLYTYQFIDTRGLGASSFLNQAVSTSMESLLSKIEQGDDGNSDDADAEHENLFRIKISPKLSWDQNLTLDLYKDEADFFSDRIISLGKNKIIAHLLTNEELWQVYIISENFMQFARSTVQMPLEDKYSSILTLAHDFSELMYGAHIAYNCQLHKRVFNSDYFDEEWNDWITNIQSNMIDFANFNPHSLFEFALTTRSTTIKFVENWWRITQMKFPDLSERDHLIQQQEAMVKGSKARIRWDKTDDVIEQKWLGLHYFDYRFSQARTILKDIKTGLQN